MALSTTAHRSYRYLRRLRVLVWIISSSQRAYNAEKYLRTCLESVIGQTFTSWELIIADDGSTDSTGAIADEFAAKDGRIKVLHLNRHGVSAARNACIDAANGKYLAYVDADDLLEPDYLKALYEKSEESNAYIVQCSFFVDSDENKTPDTNPVDKTYEDADSVMKAFFAGTHGDIRDSTATRSCTSAEST